jgi:S-formylglutathione hydrolase FrmB
MQTRNTLTTVVVFILALAIPFATIADEDESVPAQREQGGQHLKLEIYTTLMRPIRSQDYEREVDVYLPAAYVNDTTMQQRFPVIYLLHGSPGKPTDFEKNGHWPELMEQNINQNGLGPAILVSPDGNFLGAEFGDSEWLNSSNGEDRYEDFVVDQVVPYIDAHYRTIASAKGRIIGGVSEGGFGAVNIALHRPTVFSAVLACSGYYNNDGSGWARRAMGHDKAFLAYNSPLSYIDDPNAVEKFLPFWQSEKFFIGSGVDEKRYSVESAEMADKLRNRKIPLILYQPVGRHGWELWNNLFITGLKDLYPQSPTNDSDTSPTDSSST